MNKTLIIPTDTFLSAKVASPKEKEDEMPSFTVMDTEGNLIPTIKHCFIQHMIIPLLVPPKTMRADNGHIYQCVYDSVRIKHGQETLKAIVSFQEHTYGRFAVIRDFRAPKAHFNQLPSNVEAKLENLL